MMTPERSSRPARSLLVIVTSAVILAAPASQEIVARLTPPSRETAGYEYSIVGNPRDVQTRTRPGLVLQGGGTDINESLAWMIDRSGGGDFLVIRAEGSDAYNSHIARLTTPGGLRADSVATLIVPTRRGASDPFVVDTIDKAEALWIAGGDQALYVALWKDTPLVLAIHAALARGVPVGGTSSGLDVMGEFLYSAEHDPVPRCDLTSRQMTLDPFGLRVTLVRRFLDIPALDGVILDSHFLQKDRMGRLVGFLGRISESGWSRQGEVKGIGIERQTALHVEPDGRATVIGHPAYHASAAYFVRMPRRPEVCRPGAPLFARDVVVTRVAPGETFDLRSWSAAEGQGVTYSVAVNAGRIVSSHPSHEVYAVRYSYRDKSKPDLPMFGP
jgi:cyanophycinase